MDNIKTSAPGKLLLLGDHAVVYGYPCLVTAVDKRLYVEAEHILGEEDDISTPQVKESRFVLETLSYFKERFHINSGIRIQTKGDFSHQVGLGSSSAVTVATFFALNTLFRTNLSRKELFDMSYHVTLLIQGVGSGFDVAAATFGRTLYYVKGGTELKEIKNINLPLIIGYSGIKADTPFYIRKVAEAFKTKQKEMNRIFLRMKECVLHAKSGLENNNLHQTGEAMNQNHTLLQELGVSTPQLDAMVQTAIKNGAHGAKLSGAGGGDCMIALTDPERMEEVKKAIVQIGGEIITAQVNTEGVRIE